MAESLQQSLRRQMLSAAAAGSAAFEMSGTLPLSKPLKLYFMDHNDQDCHVTFPLPGNAPTELQPLLDACSPAMFGLGRQTLHDESVRKALQLPADRLGLSLDTSLPSQDILEDIYDLMMPLAADTIRAEAYALNVYSPGGFFKAHRDTPASTDMFGSLIFCLPTEFTGGELIIRSPDLSTSVTHDWGSTSSARLADTSSSGSVSRHGGLAWAAMYSDCEHEIKPVTTGHRVTLTYRLYQPSYGTRSSSQDSSSSENLGSISAARESAFGAQLAAALSDATWYPDGVTLGLVLEHFYAVEPLQESLQRDFSEGEQGGWDYYNDTPNNMPESIEPHNLKGADLQLHRAARAFGLDVQIVPVASLRQYDEYDQLGGTVSSRPLSPRELAVFRSFSDDPTGGDEYDPHNSFNDPAEKASRKVPKYSPWAGFLKKNIALHCAPRINGELVWIKRPGKQHLKYCGPAKEYEGNSANTTCFYAAAALLLVQVPAVGAPERQG